MARVTFVKSARKDNPDHGIKKGDSYYYWSFRSGRSSRKLYSKTLPRRSQLTQSEYYATMYDLEDDFQTEYDTSSEAEAAIEELKNSIQEVIDELEEKISNMEEAWPNGCPTLETLNERKDNLDSMISDLDSPESLILRDDENDDDSKFTVDISWNY